MTRENLTSERLEASSGWLRRFVPVRLRPTESTRRVTRRQRLAQLAAALAVLVCLVGAWGVVRNPFGTSAVHPGKPITGFAARDNPAAQGPPGVSARQDPAPVPSDLDIWSVSAPDHQHRFVLASAPCGSQRCPTLLRSTDAGRTWQRIHSFAHTDTSAAGRGVQPVVQPPGALSNVTFLDSRIGYIFGGDAWVTTDGGASFTRIAHPDATVLDVSLRGKSAVVLSAQGCVQGSCSGPLDVATMPAGSHAPLPQPTAAVSPSAGISSAALAGSGRDVLLLAQGALGSSGASPGAWRLDGSSLAPMPVSSVCHGSAVVAATAAHPDARSDVAALCDATPADDSTSYSTLHGAHDGREWHLLGAGNLTLPTQGRPGIATADGVHLVATTGGPRLAADGTNRVDTRTSVAISADGGRSWQSPKKPPRKVSGGFDSVVCVSDRELWALPHQGSTLWRSLDQGATWQSVTLSGSSG